MLTRNLIDPIAVVELSAKKCSQPQSLEWENILGSPLDLGLV
jgi:hypothetical protein